MLRSLGVVLGLVASCQAAPAGLPLRDLTAAKIIVVVTPGKPGAPSEEIAVTQQGSEADLTVVRREPGGKVLQKAYRKIPFEDLKDLWKLIEDRKLRSFEPHRTDRPVSDFGLRQLRLEWTAGADRGTREVSWEGEIDNESQITLLFRHLASLARRHAPQVRLSYFPRDNER